MINYLSLKKLGVDGPWKRYQSEINITKTRRLNGASYIELPEFFKKKHAVVNIECGGNQCFAHSVMVGLYPAKDGSSSQNKLHSYPHWKNRELGLKLREEDFPISYADIPQFGEDNDIYMNIYEVYEQGETSYSSYRTTEERQGMSIYSYQRTKIEHTFAQ
ncbi:hypothetical protein QAD02_008009 [Eretmocerus hayati]|uniref:Uncharacterized protein n=1 Tax=Eretmocerus hayati TaxID=131215 RepID=A0ACC2N5A5_9HYME|nr:hypothetical protein QAD02_008009 [Eretmocerus hayati]